jgi:hypothetical protein
MSSFEIGGTFLLWNVVINHQEVRISHCLRLQLLTVPTVGFIQLLLVHEVFHAPSQVTEFGGGLGIGVAPSTKEAVFTALPE